MWPCIKYIAEPCLLLVLIDNFQIVFKDIRIQLYVKNSNTFEIHMVEIIAFFVLTVEMCEFLQLEMSMDFNSC